MPHRTLCPAVPLPAFVLHKMLSEPQLLMGTYGFWIIAILASFENTMHYFIYIIFTTLDTVAETIKFERNELDAPSCREERGLEFEPWVSIKLS